jgi:hypothetical protein
MLLRASPVSLATPRHISFCTYPNPRDACIHRMVSAALYINADFLARPAQAPWAMVLLMPLVALFHATAAKN